MVVIGATNLLSELFRIHPSRPLSTWITRNRCQNNGYGGRKSYYKPLVSSGNTVQHYTTYGLGDNVRVEVRLEMIPRLAIRHRGGDGRTGRLN